MEDSFILMVWDAQDPDWDFKDNKAFFKKEKKYLKQLNPSLKNLYEFFGDNTQEINGVKVPVFRKNSFSIYEEEVSQINTKKIRGKSTNLFYKEKDKYFLAELNVFETGTIKIARIPDVMVGDISEIDKMFEEGALTTIINDHDRLNIVGLGAFSVSNIEMVSQAEKIQEIKDIYESLKS